MANLKWQHAAEAVTVAAHATDGTCLLRVEAPANQGLRVRFSVFGKSSSANPPVQFTVRRGSNTTGGTTVALTLVKRDGMRTETVQGSVKRYSAQPTDKAITNGSIVAAFTRLPSEAFITQWFDVNGGETLTLWGIVATSAALSDVYVDGEE